MELTQYFPNPGQARIVFCSKDLSRQALGIPNHGAELEDLEMFPSAADPFLRIENRPAIFQPDGERHKNPDYQPQGKQQDISDNDDGQVESAFISVTHANAFVHAL